MACQVSFDSPVPMIVVGSPSVARRLQGAQPEAFAREPLLGDAEPWERWFAAAGVRTHVIPVAIFNDAGLMFQAAEQNLGLAIGRELLAADALRDGSLVRLSDLSVVYEHARPYHFVYPPSLREWPPLVSLRQWLHDELELSRKALHPVSVKRRAKSGKR